MTDIKVMQFGVNDLCGLKGGIITPSLLFVPAAEKKKPLWVFLLELAQGEQRGCSAGCCWEHGTHSAQGLCQGRQEGCSSTPSEAHSLSPHCLVACLSLKMHSLLAMGKQTRTRQLPTHPTCPPSFSISTWQFDHLHLFFSPLSFSCAETQPVHQSCPEAAQLLLMGDSPQQGTCVLPATHSVQNMPCATTHHSWLILSLPIPAVSGPGGGFGLMANFASAAVAGREAAGTQCPQFCTSTSLSQPSLPTSTLWCQIWVLTCVPSLCWQQRVMIYCLPQYK